MYNVLEKLKSGEALNTKEKVIHEQGLVSVLKQLHDKLDLAVLEAYGWSDLAPLINIVNGNTPSPLRGTPPTAQGELNQPPLYNRGGAAPAAEGSETRTETKRLVDLNSQRAEEEKQGIIRWLRPDYQNPQGAIVETTQTTTQTEMDVETETAFAITTEKQTWPKGDIEQVKAVVAVLTNSKTPLSIDAIAAHFSGKGQWKKRLPGIVNMLVAVGRARMQDDAVVGV